MKERGVWHNFDHEFCLNAAVVCDEFEIEKTVNVI